MFLFKKITAQFFSPISLTLELIILGLLLLSFTSRQKAGKSLIAVGVLIFVICSYTPSVDILISPLKNKYPPYTQVSSSTIHQIPETIVVLGGGYNPETSLPLLARIGHDSLIRLVEGIRIYNMSAKGKLLLSGGGKEGVISSAEGMAELAVQLGVHEKDIVIESKSRDTKDQAQIIHSMLGDVQFILVTSSSHMPRSLELFAKLGMKPIPAPTRSIEQKLLYRTPNPFFPSSVNLQKAELAFHEYLGIIWAKLRSQI